MEEEPLLLPPGSIIREPAGGTYVVEALLGKGGFGAVYLVREQHGQRQQFALKEEITPNRYHRASFSVEADILRRLQHPALPRVYRVFEDRQHQRGYMLMEYIAGQNLDILWREQPEQHFSLPQVLELLAPIVDALIFLHQQDPPIVHRDIKPANIIVPTSHTAAMLVDFGVAKEYVDERTTNAVRPASPGYAAPEQYSGGTTPRSDIYSLGATCYVLLTGQVPPHALRRAISKDGDLLQPAHKLVPAIPEGVAHSIERAMAIHSEDRFETVAQFWKELSSQSSAHPEELAHQNSLVVPPPPPEHRSQNSEPRPMPKAPPVLQGRTRSIMAVLVLLLLVAVVGWASVLNLRSRSLSSPGVVQRVTPTLRASSGMCEAPSAATSLSTPALGSSVYPSLAPTYAGTIYDNLTTQRTALCLTNIQQQEGKIRGTLQGLGLVGTFQGAVTTDGKLSFTMPLYSGMEMLVCMGTIKVAGDITGIFQVYDQQGNFTGESGIWNASVYKSS